MNLPTYLLRLQRNNLALGLILMSMLGSAVTWAEDPAPVPVVPEATTTPPAALGNAPTSTDDLIKSLKANLLDAQKQAYTRELELKNLKGQLHEQTEDAQKNPWVPVNVTGVQNKNALQPAVATPEALKTSIEYYKHQYILKPGDKLAVNVIGEDPNKVSSNEATKDDVAANFLQNITILTDGTIVLPPIGIVHVAGKTLKQLNDEMNTKISQYYRFAVITVSLAEAAPDDILILGKIKQQGYQKVPVGTTISQLFKQAGGIDDRADMSHIFIRKKSDGNVYIADMDAFLDKGDIGQDMILQAGDVVVVPEGQTEISYDKYKDSTFLPKEFPVQVLGAVGKSDDFIMNPGDNIAAAIAKAGGVQAHATKNKITLIREDEATKSIKTISLTYNELKDPARNAVINVALRPNDIIFVDDPTRRRVLYNMITNALPNASTFFTSQSLFHILFSKSGG